MSNEKYNEEEKEEEVMDDPCPECGTQLINASGGGVKCPNPKCDYWFCS